MELKDLVPPVELCAEIPEGKFADSGLVWCYDGDFWHIHDRIMVIPFLEEDTHPAPTLAEIMKELPAYNEKEICLCCIADFPEYGKKRVLGEAWRVGYTERESKLDTNPATAALKLWLSVMFDKSDKSEKSVKSVETPQ